jgi:ribosomal protein L32
MGPFWDFSLSRRISDASVRAEEGAMTAEAARGLVLELESKVNKLTLVNHALFDLIAPRLGITESDLIEKMNEIDMRDGKLDGQESTPTSNVCEQCGRTYSRRHNHCLYCGHINRLYAAF